MKSREIGDINGGGWYRCACYEMEYMNVNDSGMDEAKKIER